MGENHLISFTLVFVAAAAAVSVSTGQAQGTDICEKSDHPELCKSTVKGATDPAVALQTGIEQLLSETKLAKDAAAKLGTTQSLETCNQNFDSAIEDLSKSLENLKGKDKKSLASNLSGAKTNVVTCDDTVEELGGIVGLASGVLKPDSLLRDMADNLLYLTSLLP